MNWLHGVVWFFVGYAACFVTIFFGFLIAGRK